MNNTSPIIKLAAAITLNPQHEMLLVRKQGSQFFMQAGGKIECDESPREALLRELNEELTLTVLPQQPEYIGEFSAPAANEAGHIVQAHLFLLRLAHQHLQPAAEIEEICWVTPQQALTMQLAPLTHNTIVPLIINKQW